jgi:hypothetical protein
MEFDLSLLWAGSSCQGRTNSWTGISNPKDSYSIFEKERPRKSLDFFITYQVKAWSHNLDINMWPYFTVTGQDLCVSKGNNSEM